MIQKLILKLPWSEIREASNQHKLDPLLIAALIIHESSVNQYAMRYEPGWKYWFEVRTLAELVGSSVPTEEVGQATSWGYMQIMGGVCREYGYRGWFPRLCQTKVNLWYGCTYLKRKMTVYNNTLEAVAAYNAGSVRKTDGGMFTNEKYVDSVMRHYRRLQSIKA